MKKRLALWMATVLILCFYLTGCGSKASQGQAVADPNIGTYRMLGMNGLPLEFLPEALGYDSEEEVRDAFVIELKEGGKGTIAMMGDGPDDCFWKAEGDRLTLSEIENPGDADEKITGKIANGGMVLDMAENEFILSKDGSEEAAYAMSTKENPLEALENAGKTAEPDADIAETEKEEKGGKVERTLTGASADTDLGNWTLEEVESEGEKTGPDILQYAGETRLQLKEDGEAEFILFDSEMECTWEEGKLILYGVMEYPFEREGGQLTLDMNGTKYIFVRGETDTAAEGGQTAERGQTAEDAQASSDRNDGTVEAGQGQMKNWYGLYTKFVGDDEPSDSTEDFGLHLYEDGTGIHFRDGLEIEVTWEQNGSEITMQEDFMGMVIDYVGTISEDELHLFNGDPEDEWTCEYVYVIGGGVNEEPPAGLDDR